MLLLGVNFTSNPPKISNFSPFPIEQFLNFFNFLSATPKYKVNFSKPELTTIQP